MSLLLLLQSQAEAVDTLTLLPATGTPARGDSYALIATLLDEDGNPRVGEPLDFTVTGANPQTFSDDTDVLGQVTFNYVGTNAGLDTVTVEVAGVSSGTLDTWTAHTNAGTNHGDEGAACAVGRKIHYLGGATTLRRHDVYDLDTGLWTNLSDLPTDHRNHRAEVVNGIIYIFGPQADGNSMIAYNPDTDSYTTKTDIPNSAHRRASFVIDGVIYICGGFSGVSGVDAVYAYDPVADSYTAKASLPQTRYFASGTATGGKGYLLGGAVDGVTDDSTHNTEYDPIANDWTALTAMPLGRNALYVTAGDGFLWAIGGVAGGASQTENRRYDIAGDSWSAQTATPFNQRYAGWATVDGGLHIMIDTHTHWRYEAFEDVEESESATVTWSVVGSGHLGRRSARVVP